MTLRSVLSWAMAAALAAFVLPSPAAAAPPGLAEGQAAFQAQRWEEAAAGLEKAVAAEPGNAEAWYQLGVSRRELKQYDRAVAAIEKAAAAGFPAERAAASLAIVYSLSGDVDRSLAKLDEAFKGGVPIASVKDHPGLAAVRADARFKGLIEEADRRAHPCENDPRYRAFDFWAGDWEVYARGGRKVGDNRIERALRGCLIAENWTDSAGSSGKSMNYFDAAAGKWKQHWVSDGGNMVFYEGEVKDGAMHYQGESKDPDGTVTLHRVTLTPRPDGSLRHVIEESKDGGKTWMNAFDAVYVKRGQAPPAG